MLFLHETMAVTYRFASALSLAMVCTLPLAAQNPPRPDVTSKVAPDLAGDSRVAWLQRFAVPIRSVAPADVDFADLEPLREAIGEAQIVLLGEQTHGDGTTFLAKTRLIKFLHEEMGFDVLVWESGFYDVAKAWERIEHGEDALTAIRRAVYGVWTRVQEVQPLIDYIEARARTSRPLEIAGADLQQSGTASVDFLAADLKAFLDEAGVRSNALNEGAPFRIALDSMSSLGGFVPPDSAFLDTILALRREAERKTGGRTAHARYWLQVLQSLHEQARSRRALAAWYTREDSLIKGLRTWTAADSAEWVRTYNIRDVQMAKNLLWLVRERYPDRKIIVWAASAHLTYGAPHTDRGFLSMGELAHEALGDKVYQIGFTAYQGTAYSPNWRRQFAVGHTPGEIEFEDLMHATGHAYAFVDLLSPPGGGGWLNEPIFSRPIANRPIKASWPRYVDGLFYMRELEPATRSSR